MTVGDTFSAWYDRIKSAVTETIGPGQQKGEDLDSCVRQVMAQGHDRESAYAICNGTLKASLEKSERDELLDTSRAMSKYDPQIPLTFKNLIAYSGVDVKGEGELALPKSCRRCKMATRVKGSYMCPHCDPDVNAEKGDFEVVGTGVQEASDGGGDEDEKGETEAETRAARKVYLTPANVEEAPSDAQVKSDEHGLYYEETVDVSQKASIPDNATRISDRSEAPEGARVIRGDRGGLAYLPPGEDAEDEDGEGDGDQSEDEEGEGPEGVEFGEPYTLTESVAGFSAGDTFVPVDTFEGDDGETRVRLEDPDGDKSFFIPHLSDWEDLMEPADGSSEGGDDQGQGEDEDGGDEPADPVEQSAAEAEEALGIGVDYDGFTEDQAAAVNKSLAGLDEMGLLDGVSQVSTAPPDVEWGEGDFQNTNAFIRWPQGELYLNPEQVDEEQLERQAEEQQIAVGSVAGTVAHEVGHLRHYDHLEETGQFDEVDEAELTGEEMMNAETMVSYYAMSSAEEFVAEVHAMKVTGAAPERGENPSFDRVLDIYEKYGGPEVDR